MFLLLHKGLAVAILVAAAGVEALPLNSDGGFDSFYFEPIDLGQATTYTEPPINIGSTDPFLGSNFPSVNENTNLLAQNIEQPIDFGSLSSKFLPLDQNSNLLAQNSEQPIDFGSLSSNFLPVDQNSNLVAQTFEQPIDLGSFSSSNPLPNDENSNLLALGQNFQPTTLGETFTFPNSGGGFSTTPEPNFGLQIATAMSCPSGGDFFCCPDKSDENCIPKQDHPFCYDVASIFCCHNVDANASNKDLNRKGKECYQPAGK